MITTANELISIPVPPKTASYKPVSNLVLMDMVKEVLYKNDLTILDESYSTNSLKTQMFASYTLNNESNGQRMMVGFRNSYDKSLAVGFVAGSSVIVCSNLMLKGDIKLVRKHTSNVFNDLNNIIGDTIDVGYVELESNIKRCDEMKALPMTREEMAKHAGKMFVQTDLINSAQLSIVKREINQSANFREETRWDFYNHLTEALKKTHVSEIMQKHIDVSKYVMQI